MSLGEASGRESNQGSECAVHEERDDARRFCQRRTRLRAVGGYRER